MTRLMIKCMGPSEKVSTSANEKAGLSGRKSVKAGVSRFLPPSGSARSRSPIDHNTWILPELR